MKQPKKSEMLEVRLSHPDKLALQKQAASEGRTVSDVVRGLISSYLSQGKTRSKPSHLTELFMTLKTRPKSTFATLTCAPLLLIPFLMHSTASAENVSLSLKGEFIAQIEENGEEAKRVRRFNSEVHVTPGSYMAMRIPSLLAQGSGTGFYLTLKISEVEELGAESHLDKNISLHLTFCEVAERPPNPINAVEITATDVCDNANIIAQPQFITRYGDEVTFKMGDEKGETFTMKTTPRKIKA